VGRSQVEGYWPEGPAAASSAAGPPGKKATGSFDLYAFPADGPSTGQEGHQDESMDKYRPGTSAGGDDPTAETQRPFAPRRSRLLCESGRMASCALRVECAGVRSAEKVDAEGNVEPCAVTGQAHHQQARPFQPVRHVQAADVQGSQPETLDERRHARLRLRVVAGEQHVQRAAQGQDVG